MENGIAFFEKNFIDLSRGDEVSITITDAVAADTGSDVVSLLRNRRNTDGWSTTDSTDAANTQIDVDLGEPYLMTDLFLVLHNFAAYTVQYYDGASYVDFSVPIAETSNALTTTRHTFSEVTCQLLRIIITGTLTANDDKYLAQLIVTKEIGQLQEGFAIEKAERNQKRIVTKTLSGKVRVNRSVGSFSCTLSRDNVVNPYDLSVIERLFDYHDGFLVWLCGGDIDQFRTERIGYRRQDLFLMIPTSEYTPQWDDGFYQRGINLSIDLQETV